MGAYFVRGSFLVFPSCPENPQNRQNRSFCQAQPILLSMKVTRPRSLFGSRLNEDSWDGRVHESETMAVLAGRCGVDDRLGKQCPAAANPSDDPGAFTPRPGWRRRKRTATGLRRAWR